MRVDYICDLCSEPCPAWRLPVAPFEEQLDVRGAPQRISLNVGSTSGFALCDSCMELWRQGDDMLLVQRYLRKLRPQWGEASEDHRMAMWMISMRLVQLLRQYHQAQSEAPSLLE